jgi:hypothetical protein
MPRRGLAAVVFVAAFALAGSTRPDEFPTGTFTASKQKDWSLKFAEKGKFEVLRSDKAVVKGTYKVNGKEVTLTDEEGEFASKDATMKTGKYKWEYADGKLTFKVVDDKSKGRELILTTNEWVEKK